MPFLLQKFALVKFLALHCYQIELQKYCNNLDLAWLAAYKADLVADAIQAWERQLV